MVAEGLDGIETYYQGYKPDRVGFLRQLCAQHGLVPTGGSDFHGFPLAGHASVVNEPGSVEVPQQVRADLEARLAARRTDRR
jgi:hypothetical protein